MEIGNREKAERRAFSMIEDESLLEQTDGEKCMEGRLERDGWKALVRGITLPQQRKDAIMEQVKDSQTEKRWSTGCKAFDRMRKIRLVPAAVCMLLILATVSMTA